MAERQLNAQLAGIFKNIEDAVRSYNRAERESLQTAIQERHSNEINKVQKDLENALVKNADLQHQINSLKRKLEPVEPSNEPRAHHPVKNPKYARSPRRSVGRRSRSVVRPVIIAQAPKVIVAHRTGVVLTTVQPAQPRVMEAENSAKVTDPDAPTVTDPENAAMSAETECICDDSEEEEFACDQCEKKFASKRGLNGHKVIHSSKMKYECDQCKRTFTRKTDLTKHKRVHTKTVATARTQKSQQ